MRYEGTSKKFRKFFQLSASPVAIKISKEVIAGQRPKLPARFCEFVRSAAYGGKSNVSRKGTSATSPQPDIAFMWC